MQSAVMVARCDSCGRLFLDTDSNAFETRPRCVSCLIDAMERESETRGDLESIARALRTIASIPASWYRARHQGRVK